MRLPKFALAVSAVCLLLVNCTIIAEVDRDKLNAATSYGGSSVAGSPDTSAGTSGDTSAAGSAGIAGTAGSAGANLQLGGGGSDLGLAGVGGGS